MLKVKTREREPEQQCLGGERSGGGNVLVHRTYEPCAYSIHETLRPCRSNFSVKLIDAIPVRNPRIPSATTY